MPLIRGAANSVGKRHIVTKQRVINVGIFSGNNDTASNTQDVYIYSGTTSGASQQEIFINGIENLRHSVATGQSTYYNGHCYGVEDSDPTKFIYYRVNGVIYNNSGTTNCVNNIEKLRTTTSQNTKLIIEADDTGDELRIYGLSGTGLTHNWYIKLNYHTI